jgi:hypothetical protein
VSNARASRFEFEHGINVVWFSASDATAGKDSAKVTADLEVSMNDEVVGFITKHIDGSHGAVPAAQFGTTPPVSFRTLEGALEHLLPGAADGLDGTAGH